MRKLLTLVLAISFALSMNGTAHAGITNPDRQPLDDSCRFQLDDGHLGWTVTEVHRTIRCAVRRWPVPGGVDYAMDIARRESGLRQYALNPSGCAGIYQWAPSTWASVLDDFPPLYKVLGHGVFNARSNVMYAIKFAHNRSWSPWS
jgi:hypothetical protein